MTKGLSKKEEETLKELIETSRRIGVALSKEAGEAIECIERERMLPITVSLMQRINDFLYFLGKTINLLSEWAEKLLNEYSSDPERVAISIAFYENIDVVISPLFQVYNSIIQDIKVHYSRKDSYVESFKERPLPSSYKDVPDELYQMFLEMKQIKAYLIRWLPICPNATS